MNPLSSDLIVVLDTNIFHLLKGKVEIFNSRACKRLVIVHVITLLVKTPQNCDNFVKEIITQMHYVDLM